MNAVAAEAAKSSREALECAQEMIKRLGALKQREGISLLEVKGRDMVAYVRDMALLMASMSMGESIQGAEEITRCIKHRTVLEKVRVLEKKMATQIDKLTAAATGDDKKKKEVLRARPDQMELDDEDVSDEEDDEEEGGSKKKKAGSKDDEGKVRKYVPPKVMAVHYDETEDARADKKKALLRKRAMQSSLVQELKAQYSEAPEEITEYRGNRRKADRERIDYEEDYYMRTQLNKKEKAARRREDRENAIDSLLKFGDYMAGDENEMKRREKLATEGDGKKKDSGKRKGKSFKGGPSAKKPKRGGGGGRGRGGGGRGGGRGGKRR